MKRIDEQGYKDGGSAFHKGKTLRSIFDSMSQQMEAAAKGDEDAWEQQSKIETFHISMFLGFADAFLTHIRRR